MVQILPLKRPPESRCEAMMRVALYQPDIAGNVGAILRTSACLGVGVDLIEPMGFAFSASALRRAGMDYADAVQITRHADWNSFEAQVTGRIVLLTAHGAAALHATDFKVGDTLLLGSEGSGAPPDVHARADLRVRIPIAQGLRSLNISVAAGIALAEALRQTGGWPE